MEQRGKCILIFLIMVILSSCSNPNLNSVKRNNLFDLEKPNSEKARVIFIRPQTGFSGQGVIAVYHGNDLIGGLSGNSYFIYDTEPGEHIFGCYASPPRMDFLKANIAGGRTYYAQCSYQDRVLTLAGKIIAIKKNSDLMKKLNNILPRLKNSTLTDDGVSMYTVQNEKSGKHIIDRRASMVTYRIDIEGLREEWLKKAKVVQKPELSNEDGF